MISATRRKQLGVGDARTPKFMYDPFVHIPTRGPPRRHVRTIPKSSVDELRPETARSQAPTARNFNRTARRLASKTAQPAPQVRRMPASTSARPLAAGADLAGTGFGQPGVLGAERQRRAARVGRPAAEPDRLVRRNEVLLAVADQVGAAHALQRLAQHRPILRVVIAQEGLVQATHLDPLRNDDLLARARDAP